MIVKTHANQFTEKGIKCLDCPAIVDNREHGTGAKIRCNECQKIHRIIQNKGYNRVYYLKKKRRIQND